jgi:cardiolipin synthase A/B
MPEFVAGNTITLLENGTQYFPALETAIRAARHEIHLQTYIFSFDDTGQSIAYALKMAARRGVQCYVVVDGFGSRDYLPQAMVEDMRDAGVQVIVFRPDSERISRRHRLRRMHRKIVLIDGRIAFVGGINIIDDMYTPRHKPPRYDYAVQIEGPLVQEVRYTAHHLWQLLSLIYEQRRWRSTLPETIALPNAGPHRAALLVRDNLIHRSDIEEAYMEALESAQHEIVVACAYFFPGLAFRRALIDAAQRGVRVILLLQARVEYVWLHYAARALYGTLLDAGVEIFEYYKSFMHAKVAVIDRQWATVGSSNIDPFSLVLSREANVAVHDKAFAAQLRDSLQRALDDGARSVKPQDWKRRPVVTRAATWIAYSFGRLMMGLMGVSQR